MAELNISSTSWLNFSRLLELEGTVFWDETNLPDIPFSNQDEFIQLNRNQAKRLDLLAYDKYGDPELWWVILQANNIDLPNQIYEGLQIRIPAKETIDTLFEERAELNT